MKEVDILSKGFPDKNLLINDYLQELFALSSEIVKTFDQIETLVHSRKPGMEGVFTLPHAPNKYFFIQPEVFTKIATIQVHSANIKKILFATPRKKGEAKYKYDYRVKRAEEIQSYFDIEEISEIRISNVRNSLEHFDERLDNISLRLWNGTINKKYHIIASNIIISSEGALYGNPYYLKCYVIDSKIYKNAEQESNIGQLVSEAKYIRKTTKDFQLTGSVIPIPQNLNK